MRAQYWILLLVSSVSFSLMGDRSKMKLADAGSLHALLTAQLSKAGNELDIYFETAEHTPLPIGLQQFNLEAIRASGQPWLLQFVCAPATERPKGEVGHCSHFVARAGWLQPTEKITVKGRIYFEDQEAVFRWDEFIPKKYAHQEE